MRLFRDNSITTAAPYAVATVAFSAAATTIALYGIGASVTVVGTALTACSDHGCDNWPNSVGRWT